MMPLPACIVLMFSIRNSFKQGKPATHVAQKAVHLGDRHIINNAHEQSIDAYMYASKQGTKQIPLQRMASPVFLEWVCII